MAGRSHKTGVNAPVPVTYYAWGLDHSHTLQGAGGAGGLLGMFTGLDASPAAYCAVNDGLGNVVGLMDGYSGLLAAEYEYSPFGELLRAAGPMAAQNVIRFSSKYMDVETGLVNFGFRYYSASLGRFLNRDPQGEAGWANLFDDLDGGGGSSWNYIGDMVKHVHEDRYGGEDSSMAHTTESSDGFKNSTDTSAPLRDRKTGTSSVGGISVAAAGGDMGTPNWEHPYGFLDNDPLDDVEYLGLWSLQSSYWGRPGGLFGSGGLADQSFRIGGSALGAIDRGMFFSIGHHANALITGNGFGGRTLAFENLLKATAINAIGFGFGAMRVAPMAAANRAYSSAFFGSGTRLVSGAVSRSATRSSFGSSWSNVAGQWKGWGKGFADTGRYRWNSGGVRSSLTTSGFAQRGQTVHHRIIAQGETRGGAGQLSTRGFFKEQYGRYVPNFIKNSRWNLQPIGSRNGRWTAGLHNALHQKNPDLRMGTLGRVWHGTTAWDKAAIGGAGVATGAGAWYLMDD